MEAASYPFRERCAYFPISRFFRPIRIRKLTSAEPKGGIFALIHVDNYAARHHPPTICIFRYPIYGYDAALLFCVFLPLAIAHGAGRRVSDFINIGRISARGERDGFPIYYSLFAAEIRIRYHQWTPPPRPPLIHTRPWLAPGLFSGGCDRMAKYSFVTH